MYVARHPVLRSLILLFATTTAVTSAVAAAMTFRIVRDLGESPGAFGLTLTGLGVGTLLGSWFATRLGPGTNVARVLAGAIVVMGLPLLAAAAIPSLPAIVVLSGLSGAGGGGARRPLRERACRELARGARGPDREHRPGDDARAVTDRLPRRRPPDRQGGRHGDARHPRRPGV